MVAAELRAMLMTRMRSEVFERLAVIGLLEVVQSRPALPLSYAGL